MLEGSIARGTASIRGLVAALGRAQLFDRPLNDKLMNTNAYEEDQAEESQLHILVALATLMITTAMIGLCAELMVDSISAVTASGTISEDFVGLILIPIATKAAEHSTAVTVALRLQGQDGFGHWCYHWL
ncbi:hypothetical protein BP5796_04019 [Coleophoma crateriformis]|uniref:Sodium/calcium exchanger membrane region domain-containing protein n=1 Tax=Coleophoma crateriformis TaxID=565419 RepID=A0A3D8SHQ7_9HELO|nr:hypothetical protein BP5796_04019 [Coleophoma crateriformis]